MRDLDLDLILSKGGELGTPQIGGIQTGTNATQTYRYGSLNPTRFYWRVRPNEVRTVSVAVTPGTVYAVSVAWEFSQQLSGYLVNGTEEITRPSTAFYPGGIRFNICALGIIRAQGNTISVGVKNGTTINRFVSVIGVIVIPIEEP